MIEINLLGQKKPLKLPVILGVDLALVKFKPLIAAFLLSYIPDYLIYPEWESEIKAIEDEVMGLNKQLRKAQADVKGNVQVKKQLEAFNRQVSRLKERSSQVDKIIKKRTNPNKLLERIARNIPEDMWLTELTIDSGRKVLVRGNSTSYKSIGNFIILANESSFFGKTLTLSDSKTIEDTENKNKRVEDFTIQGTVESFDPWQQ